MPYSGRGLRSIFTLLERAWRLIAGRVEVSDTKLKQFLQETRDIEKFSFIYGLKPETIKEMHELITWINGYSIGVIDAQRAKKWIDIKTTEIIKAPPKSYMAARLVAIISCALFVILSPIPLSSSFAFLKLKETNTWFLMDNNIAKSITESWLLKKEQCPTRVETEKTVNGLKSNEYQTICKLFADNGREKFLSDTVQSQRWLLGLFIILAILWLIVLLIQINSYEAAIKIRSKIKKSNADSEVSDVSITKPNN